MNKLITFIKISVIPCIFFVLGFSDYLKGLIIFRIFFFEIGIGVYVHLYMKYKYSRLKYSPKFINMNKEDVEKLNKKYIKLNTILEFCNGIFLIVLVVFMFLVKFIYILSLLIIYLPLAWILHTYVNYFKALCDLKNLE